MLNRPLFSGSSHYMPFLIQPPDVLRLPSLTPESPHLPAHLFPITQLYVSVLVSSPQLLHTDNNAHFYSDDGPSLDYWWPADLQSERHDLNLLYVEILKPTLRSLFFNSNSLDRFTKRTAQCCFLSREWTGPSTTAAAARLKKEPFSFYKFNLVDLVNVRVTWRYSFRENEYKTRRN